MNFYRFFYESKSAHIDPNAPPKKGLTLLLEIVLRDGWDFCKLTLLFCITSLPILTLPASVAGLHTAVLRILRDIPGDIGFDFWYGWKTHWKSTAQIMGILLCCLALFGLCFFYGGSIFMQWTWMRWIGILFLLLFSMSIPYLFPMIVLVELKMQDILKNAVLLALAKPHWAVLPLATMVLLILTNLSLPFWLLPIGIWISLAILFVLSDWIALKNMERFIIAKSSDEI